MCTNPISLIQLPTLALYLLPQLQDVQAYLLHTKGQARTNKAFTLNMTGWDAVFKDRSKHREVVAMFSPFISEFTVETEDELAQIEVHIAEHVRCIRAQERAAIVVPVPPRRGAARGGGRHPVAHRR